MTDRRGIKIAIITCVSSIIIYRYSIVQERTSTRLRFAVYNACMTHPRRQTHTYKYEHAWLVDTYHRAYMCTQIYRRLTTFSSCVILCERTGNSQRGYIYDSKQIDLLRIKKINVWIFYVVNYVTFADFLVIDCQYINLVTPH